jgi:hypothetical protein
MERPASRNKVEDVNQNFEEKHKRRMNKRREVSLSFHE